MTDECRTQQTYRLERWRAVAGGIIETAGITFLLLIAVRHYHAGAMAKALIAGGGSLGLLGSPLLVSEVARRGWPASQAAARMAAVGAAGFLVAAVAPWEAVYVLGVVLGMATVAACVPLMTHIYQENYPAATRGRLFARTVSIRIAAAAIFSELAGRALNWEFGLFRALLLIFALALGFAAGCLARVPSEPLTVPEGTHPFRALRFARSDRLFRNTLVSWMFLGFGNLLMIPLRVEYLANEQHGVLLNGRPLSAATIALLTGVIPNVARLAMNPLWGWLFDSMNFFTLRIILNFGFTLGILSFFTVGSLPWLVTGAVLFGLSNAGADVAWSLWVTKFAPPGRVADYMSVHTFFTGVRGVVAPVLAFQLAGAVSMAALGWVSVALITLGTLVLVPEIKFGRGARKATALVEEVGD